MKNIIPIEQLTTRNCNARDYKFVCDLSRENMEEYTREFWGEWDAKRFRANLKGENIRIINYNKKRIGFFDVTRENNFAYLHNIQIIKLFQGGGIGAKIMSEIEEMERLGGAKKISAQVFKKNPARYFYRKLGYKIIKRGPYSLTIEKDL